MNRRRFNALTMTALAGAIMDLGQDAWSQSSPWTPLGTVAATKDILFGFAVSYRSLLADSQYDDLVARECTVITPENAMKWETIHPLPDVYDFQQADKIVQFAEAHGIKTRGHTFCWHRALPAWMDNLDKKQAEATLREHIARVAGHYRGRLHSWDVVNEAIQIKDGLPLGWRDSFWYRKIGPSYVDIAFESARQADPTVILSYNDYGLEYDNHADEAKRTSVLAFLRELKRRHVPIGALGIQSHLRAGTGESFASDLPRFLKNVRDLGLDIFLTELDVDDSRLSHANPYTRDAAVADVYKNYLDTVLSTGAVSVVETWGVWDRGGPVGAEASNQPNTLRPLLFEPESNPKLDAFEVARCFAHAPVRRKRMG